mmetsp:Transcript_65960/g.208798  ORF Transcript_65960/g.208798 Transcript_65960/m.208798 type:complete len:256 (+) Transcript_65960:351-1118(+)
MIQTPALKDGISWVDYMDRTGTLRKPYFGQILQRMMRASFVQAWYRFSAVRGHADKFQDFSEVAVEKLEDGAHLCLASSFQYFLQMPEDRVAKLSADLRTSAGSKCQAVVWGLQDKTHTRGKIDRSSTSQIVGKGGRGAGEARWLDVPMCGHCPDIEDPVKFADVAEKCIRAKEGEELQLVWELYTPRTKADPLPQDPPTPAARKDKPAGSAFKFPETEEPKGSNFSFGAKKKKGAAGPASPAPGVAGPSSKKES